MIERKIKMIVSPMKGCIPTAKFTNIILSLLDSIQGKSGITSNFLGLCVGLCRSLHDLP